MNRQTQADAGDLAIAVPDYKRVNSHQRDIVNHAISVQETSNTMSAVEYLKAHDIGADVIERVLLEPHSRRVIVPL